MSTSFVADLYVVDSERLTCYSPIDMSVAATSASVVDFDNDPPSSPVPSTLPDLSDIDGSSGLITLESFMPILKNLPGFYLQVDGKLYYMIHGSLTDADWTRLRHYTGTVSKFIVTDKFNVTDDASNARISPAAFLRLARLQSPDMFLLPNLSDLVIENADASIAFLDLLITPSLKSLNASCIPDAQQSPFHSFLTAIEREVPLLQTLILGPGRFLPTSLLTISRFNSLRHLELKHEDSTLPFGFFDNIGSLAMLETFELDVRHVSGPMTGDEPTALPAFNLSDNLPNSNVMDGNREEHSAADVGHLQTCRTPIFPFNQLKVLHVIGWLPLLEDLIHRVTSTKLEDVSVTFIRLSYDELKDSLAKEIEERERKAEEDRRREEKEKEMEMEEHERLLKERRREEKKMMNEKLWEDEMEPMEREKINDEPLCEPKEFFCVTVSNCKKKKGGKGTGRERRWEPLKMDEAMKMQEATEKQEVKVQERLPTEQERLASLSFKAHTLSFTEILRKLCLTSLRLKSLYLCQLGVSFQCLLKPSTLPEEVFRTMLLLPAIESLEVKGWILDSVEDVLSAAEPIPNLKHLLLPLDGPNFGISLPSLRHVAETCPKLESFQCYISPIPEYSSTTNVGPTRSLSHGLRVFSVGSSFSHSIADLKHPVAKRLDYLIARHLYLLFPELEEIWTSEEHDAELWVDVHKFVEIFQSVRKDDLNRR